MELILFVLAVLGIATFTPKLARVLTFLITFGFLFPLFAFGGGACIWAILTLSGISASFLTCCLLGGLPMAIFVAAFIYA